MLVFPSLRVTDISNSGLPRVVMVGTAEYGPQPGDLIRVTGSMDLVELFGSGDLYDGCRQMFLNGASEVIAIRIGGTPARTFIYGADLHRPILELTSLGAGYIYNQIQYAVQDGEMIVTSYNGEVTRYSFQRYSSVGGLVTAINTDAASGISPVTAIARVPEFSTAALREFTHGMDYGTSGMATTQAARAAIISSNTGLIEQIPGDALVFAGVEADDPADLITPIAAIMRGREQLGQTSIALLGTSIHTGSLATWVDNLLQSPVLIAGNSILGAEWIMVVPGRVTFPLLVSYLTGSAVYALAGQLTSRMDGNSFSRMSLRQIDLIDELTPTQQSLLNARGVSTLTSTIRRGVVFSGTPCLGTVNGEQREAAHGWLITQIGKQLVPVIEQLQVERITPGGLALMEETVRDVLAQMQSDGWFRAYQIYVASSGGEIGIEIDVVPLSGITAISFVMRV